MNGIQHLLTNSESFISIRRSVQKAEIFEHFRKPFMSSAIMI